jgi:hypothetical protein
MTQYPDTIVISWASAPVQDSETGEFIPGVLESHTFKCRAEVNTRSSKINGNDGNLIDYVFDVYMPKTDVVIPDFTATYLLNGTLTGTVKRGSNGQFNSRLWL